MKKFGIRFQATGLAGYSGRLPFVSEPLSHRLAIRVSAKKIDFSLDKIAIEN